MKYLTDQFQLILACIGDTK